MDMGGDHLKSRMEAARILRGVSQAELGRLFQRDGLGLHDPGRLERGEIALRRVHLDALTRHLRMPEWWFTAEQIDLPDTEHRQEREVLDEINRKVTQGVAALEKLSAAIAPVADGLDDVRELRDLFAAANPKDDDAEESAPTPKRPAAKRRAKGS